MAEAVLVSAVRTPIGRAPRGVLAHIRPDDLAAITLEAALARVNADGPKLAASQIEDVIFGCSHPEGEQGSNVARWAALRAGFPVEVPGLTISRLCASGLEAIAIATERIRAGSAQTILAGGTESMSHVPVGGFNPSPNPWFAANYPEALMNMGLTAERLGRNFGITRLEQDEYALKSHQKAVAAQRANLFADEIIPMTIYKSIPGKPDPNAAPDAEPPKPTVREILVTADEGPRPDTSMELLARLKPAFSSTGTVTAGNASPTSDGAAACLVMDAELARALNIKPMARLLSYAVTGCLPEEMGLGPVTAIPKALRIAGLSLDQIDRFELNEAFAAQVMAVLRALDLDLSKVNQQGGAIALGHALGATGARLATSLLHSMQRNQERFGMVSMCVGTGMGAAAVFERID